jgi:hypothetical protein
MAAATKKKAPEPVEETANLPATAGNTQLDTANVAPMQVKVDVADMKRPLVKLLQDLSPEVKDLGCTPGQFFATVINQELGRELTATIIGYKKRYILWNPQRGVEPMILARSEDGITWGEGEENKTFDVNIPNVGKVKWHTGPSVADSGLTLFGSSVPSNPDSKPAAAETHDFLLYLHGEDMLPVGISLARSKLTCARSLLTIAFGSEKIDPRSLKIKLKAVDAKSDSGEFSNLVPMRAGKVTPEEYHEMVALSEKFKDFSLDVDLDENRADAATARRRERAANPEEREY